MSSFACKRLSLTDPVNAFELARRNKSMEERKKGVVVINECLELNMQKIAEIEDTMVPKKYEDMVMDTEWASCEANMERLCDIADTHANQQN